MPTNPVWPIADSDSVARAFEDAAGSLDSVDGEVTFELSAVPRVDARGLRAMETLAKAAQERKVKVALHGVNVGVYKALKLMGLTRSFQFVR